PDLAVVQHLGAGAGRQVVGRAHHPTRCMIRPRVRGRRRAHQNCSTIFWTHSLAKITRARPSTMLDTHPLRNSLGNELRLSKTSRVAARNGMTTAPSTV